MLKRRVVLTGMAGSWQAMAAPEDPLARYQRQLPPNYGPGAVFQVQAQPQGEKIILTGRVLLPQEHTALTAEFRPQTVEDRTTSFPYPQVGTRCYAVVTARRVDLRAKNDSTSELVSQAVQGDTLLLLASEAKGYEVLRQWDGYRGWLPQNTVQALDPAEFRQWQQQPRVMVLSDTERYDAGAILPTDTAITPTRPLALSQTAAQVRTQVIQSAQAFYEKSRTTPYPYLWGGTYGTALDCSGFTQTVYRLAGLAIPRDTYQQQGFGQKVQASPVNLANLQAGDLLFFSENNRRATHVGIYMGAGDFLHCSGGKGNRGLGRNNLQGKLTYENFLRSIWWGAARLIPATGSNSLGLYAKV
ncbi:C40 family peptidase [Candidatus Cyanaurora vandensis]|uniref:C40 family peptidase n=1 Tax=Candidatus Cyanaurora vandensis TaxID=2714958 RepID=UPI00257E5415|nr:C40 family peptidase [Candidatus Cyanaurora vandensis]